MSNKQVVTVKNNSPGWPAMVKKSGSSLQINPPSKNSSQSNLQSAASSLWLQSRMSKIKNESSTTYQATKSEAFASKSSIVRQCPQCQILFVNFHKC
jgi:hypothetical protein